MTRTLIKKGQDVIKKDQDAKKLPGWKKDHDV
jgi:hypothetical protein